MTVPGTAARVTNDANVSFNGIDCYYEDHGEGPPVVFLHGAGGNHMSWWQQIPVFSDRYRCITIDHRGFARSTDPRGEGSSRFTDDLEALLASLEIERAALVAQSMGGRTASAFMLRHPAQVSALVMCDTLGVLVPPDLEAHRAELRKERLASAGESGVLLRGYMAVDFIRNEQARTFLYQTVQGLNPPRDAPAQADSTSREELAAIDTPVLFTSATRTRWRRRRSCARCRKQSQVLSTASSPAPGTPCTGSSRTSSTPRWVSSWRGSSSEHSRAAAQARPL